MMANKRPLRDETNQPAAARSAKRRAVGKKAATKDGDESEGYEDVDESGSDDGASDGVDETEEDEAESDKEIKEEDYQAYSQAQETQASQEPDDGEVPCGLIKSIFIHQVRSQVASRAWLSAARLAPCPARAFAHHQRSAAATSRPSP